MVWLNPGTGALDGAHQENAWVNMAAFVAELAQRGAVTAETIRRAAADRGDGRYAFEIIFGNDRRVKVDMPGWHLDDVRYREGGEQTPFTFPRLYVDDSSWLWPFAVDMAVHAYNDYEENPT